MKKSYFLVPLCFALVLHSALAQTPTPAPPLASVSDYDLANWKQFTSAEGGFTISMPGVPSSRSVPVDTGANQIVMHLFVLTMKSGEFGVAYFDLPLRSNDPTVMNVIDDATVIRRILDGSRDELFANGAKRLNENDIALDRIVGRELILDDKE